MDKCLDTLFLKEIMLYAGGNIDYWTITTVTDHREVVWLAGCIEANVVSEIRTEGKEGWVAAL